MVFVKVDFAIYLDHPVEMDSDQLGHVLLLVLGIKHSFSIWAANSFAQELSHRLIYKDEAVCFYLLSSMQLMKSSGPANVFI